MPSQPVEHAPATSPRRRFAQQLAMGLAASAAACTTPAAKHTDGSAAPTFVLVHGAWYGGWCWRKLTPLLVQAGCEVHTPTLTGLGERAHLAVRETTLQTHVQDLHAVLRMHDLRDVILVGHSYGGMVTSLVAERERERARIRRLVYLDAFVPEGGQRVVDYLLPLERREAIVKVGAETGFVPPVPVSALGVTDAADLAWINARAVKQPFATFAEPVRLTALAGAGLPRAYIACVVAGQRIVRPIRRQAARRPRLAVQRVAHRAQRDGDGAARTGDGVVGLGRSLSRPALLERCVRPHSAGGRH